MKCVIICVLGIVKEWNGILIQSKCQEISRKLSESQKGTNNSCAKIALGYRYKYTQFISKNRLFFYGYPSTI